MTSVNGAKIHANERAVGRRDATRRHWIGPLTALIDAAMVLAIVAGTSVSYHLAVYGHMGDDQATVELAGLLTAIFLFTNLLRGRYKLANYLSTRGQVAAACTAWNVTMVAFLAILFLTKAFEDFSRGVIIATYLSGIPLLGLARSAAVHIVSSASRKGQIAAERIFVIGREEEVMSFAARRKASNAGFAIVDVAFLQAGDARRAADPAALAADLAAAAARARVLKPDIVLIALPWSERETIEICVEAFMNLPVAIDLAPERILERFGDPHIARLGSLASLRLTRPALTPLELMAKRAFDLIAASLVLLVSLPLLLLIAVMIKLDSAGPVLFLQRRHGFNRQPFRIYKFRSMTTADDGEIVKQATKADLRITRVGRFLRRYNLDELPQLFNVLAGHMSLVGPRPHALAHDHAFERKIARYARRHNVKPGITGWAQVNGLRGETDTDEKMEARVAYDHWYIDNWSFGLDLAILLRTLLSKQAFQNAH